MTGIYLKIKLKKFGIGLQELAERLKISPQALNSKLNSNDLRLKFIQEVAQKIDVSIYHLIGDEEEISSHNEHQPALSIEKEAGIPLINSDILEETEENILAKITEHHPVRYNVPLFADADFLMPIKGNSMSPKYNSGDLVACKRVPLNTFFQWNKVYVLGTIQGSLIKRVKKSELKDHIKIISENTEYDPIDIPRTEIKSLSIVIGHIGLE